MPVTPVTTRPGRGSAFGAVRRDNLAVLLRLLHVNGPLSRSELVVRTGLSRSTIGGMVADLAGRGLVLEAPPARSGQPGRPSPVVQVRPDGPAVLAVDVGVDAIGVAVIGLGDRVRAHERAGRRRDRYAPDRTADDIGELTDRVLATLSEPPRLVAVGVAVPGLVRAADGFVALAPNLGWREAPVGSLVGERLSLGVPVRVANEADLGGLAESVRGAGAGCRNVVYVSGEVGVGGGIICEGVPLRGFAGYGGEVGHVPVNPAGSPCRCGATGCWETEVGEEALLRRAGRNDDEDRAGTIDALLQAADGGDPRALESLDEHGRWVGIGLSILVNVFNPERVVLGGLFARVYPYIADRIGWELDRRALQATLAGAQVLPAALGADSALIGAAELAWQETLDDPTAIPTVPGPENTGEAG